MNENVVAIFPRNESIPLFVAKPLYCSVWHLQSSRAETPHEVEDIMPSPCLSSDSQGKYGSPQSKPTRYIITCVVERFVSSKKFSLFRADIFCSHIAVGIDNGVDDPGFIG